MTVKVNLVLLGALLAGWASLTYGAPRPAFVVAPEDAAPLRDAEDRFAHHPEDVAAARHLAGAYLAAGRPALAIAVVGGGPAALLEDPTVAHRLAMAYEAEGRVDEALALVASAHARCGRALGAGLEGAARTPVPRHPCSARQHAALAAHRDALGHLVAWGVADPRRDPRTARAYEIALRRARIASAR